MKAVAAHRLLESLADITAEKDQSRFRRLLASTIREILPVDEVCFVQPLRDLSGRTAFHELGRESWPGTPLPRPQPTYAQVDAMLRDGHSLALREGRAEVMLPVRHRESLVEIVVVRAPAFAPDSLFVLKGFTRLYRNFLSLMIDNERDPLTGLFNRRTLETRLADLARDAARRHGLMAHAPPERRHVELMPVHWVAMIDIDHFKKVNDSFGHLFGDEVLLLVARLMNDAFRDDDILFRYGGEEFAAVLVAQEQGGAVAALNRFRERVAAHRFPQLSQVTVSAGITAMRGNELPAAAIARADRALYCAKQDGRNRVCEYELLLASGRLDGENAGHAAEIF